MPNVLLEIQNAIATITLNRPESMNAMNEALLAELAEVTEAVQHDNQVRAVLLRGEGPLFCVGGDIKFFYDNKDIASDDIKKVVNNINRAVTACLTMPKPVLACVHGSVAGAGLSLILAADLVIAEENTKFTTAYSGIGISPDGAMSYTLPRIVGLRKAMELIMLAEVFDAQKALALGIINYTSSADTLLEKTKKILTRLVSAPTYAFGQIKQQVNQAQQNSLKDQLTLEANSFAQCYATEDFKNGVESFLKKSRPTFKGS